MNTFQNSINFFIKDKVNRWIDSYKQIFLFVIGITSIRVFIEWTFFYFPIQLNIYQDYIRFYLENIFYFLILFLIVSLFVSKITQLELKGIMQFGVKLYPIIWMPPIIDHLCLGRTEGYYYARVENFFNNVISVYFLTNDGSLGLSLEIITGIVALFIFVFIKTKSIFKATLTAIFLHLFLAVFSTPDFFFGRGGSNYFFDIFLPTYYFIPFLILLMITLFFYDHSKFLAILKNFRAIRSLIFIMAVVLGVFARYIVNGDVYLFNPILCIFAIFFLWQVSVIINDIHDFSIDAITNKHRPLIEGAITVEEYYFLVIVFSFFAISFSAVINLKVLFLSVLFIFLAYIYSVPPLRLRNNFAGNIIIAFAILISFFMGVFSSGDSSMNLFYLFPIYSMMFLFSSVLTLAKDIKDIEGDKKCKVQNIYTLYGKEDAKKVISSLIFLVLNVPLLFFFHFSIPLLGIFAAYIYYRFENIIGVYLSGVIIIVILFYQLNSTIGHIL